MAKIQRNTIKGTGNGTVSTGGFPYVHITSDSLLTVEYTLNGRSYSVGQGKLILPPGVTQLKVIAGGAWVAFLQDSVPAVNQSEIHFVITDSRKLLIEGDDNIVFRGQDVDPATVSIAGIKDDIEQLSKQYLTALWSGTVTDAAKYCKLKTAVLARYAN